MTDERSTDIPSALRAEEWAALRHVSAAQLLATGRVLEHLGRGTIGDVAELAKIIALANAAMNDEDVRKFRRETVDMLRRLGEFAEDSMGGFGVPLLDLAEVIESFLPPRS